MNRTIAFIMSLLTLILSLTRCFNPNVDEPELYTWGNEGLGFPSYQDLNALLTSPKNEFDINDVTLDFYYCFYCLDDETLEESKEKHTGSLKYDYFYAIYIGNFSLDFELGNESYIFDYEKVNALLYKRITLDESYETNYGYTTNGRYINYNHVEKLTIPSEYFSSSLNSVSIHVIQFAHNLEMDVYYFTPFSTSITLDYKINGNKVILN